MKRTTLLVLLACLLVIPLAAGPASAHVDAVHVFSIEVNDGRVTEIHGTITCTPGEEFILRVNVTDDSGNRATGRAHGTCGQGLTYWTTTRVDSGSGFTCGEPAVDRGRARTQPDGATKTFAEQTTTCQD
jgi:hypothetical protein